jgi:hypothetical protein
MEVYRVMTLWGADIFLNNQLVGDNEVVSLTGWLSFNSWKILCNHFCYSLSWPQGQSVARRIRFTHLTSVSLKRVRATLQQMCDTISVKNKLKLYILFRRNSDFEGLNILCCSLCNHGRMCSWRKINLYGWVKMNRVQRIFAPKRDEVTGRWRKLHNGELRNLYTSPSTTRMMKSRRIRLVGQVAQMGRWRILIGYWWENQRARDH